MPPEVAQWVSDVGNGNPQYIELCAAAIARAAPPILVFQGPTDAQARAQSGGSCALAPNGLASLAQLEKPPKIMGFVKQALGALGPEDRLVVQILSLFRPVDSGAAGSGASHGVVGAGSGSGAGAGGSSVVSKDAALPWATCAVLRRAYESVTAITEEKLQAVLDDLIHCGLVGVRFADPPVPAQGQALPPHYLGSGGTSSSQNSDAITSATGGSGVGAGGNVTVSPRVSSWKSVQRDGTPHFYLIYPLLQVEITFH